MFDVSERFRKSAGRLVRLSSLRGASYTSAAHQPVPVRKRASILGLRPHNR